MKNYIAILLLTAGFNVFAGEEYNKSEGEFVLKYDVNLEKESYPSSDEPAIVKPDLSQLDCAFIVEDIKDVRRNKQAIGTNFFLPLQAKKVDDWLNDLSSDLRREVISDTNTSLNKIIIKPEVSKIYSYAQSMNLHGVIVFNVAFEKNGREIEAKYYRGAAAKTNWINGLGEYGTTVNLAAENIVLNILNDLPSICKKMI